MALEVPDQVRLVEPSEFGGAVRPIDLSTHVDAGQQAPHPQQPRQSAGAEPDDSTELAVQMSMGDAELDGDVGDRPPRVGFQHRHRPLTSIETRDLALVGREMVRHEVEHLLRARAREQTGPEVSRRRPR